MFTGCIETIPKSQDFNTFIRFYKEFMRTCITRLHDESANADESWKEVANKIQNLLLACVNDTSITVSDEKDVTHSVEADSCHDMNNGNNTWWLCKLLCLNNEKEASIDQLVIDEFDAEHCYRWVHEGNELLNKESWKEQKCDLENTPSSFNIFNSTHSRATDVVRRYIETANLPSSVKSTRRTIDKNISNNTKKEEESNGNDDDDDDCEPVVDFRLRASKSANATHANSYSMRNSSQERQKLEKEDDCYYVELSVLQTSFIAFIHTLQDAIYKLHRCWIELPDEHKLFTTSSTIERTSANVDTIQVVSNDNSNTARIDGNDNRHEKLSTACNRSVSRTNSLSDWKRLVHIDRPPRPSEELIAQIKSNFVNKPNDTTKSFCMEIDYQEYESINKNNNDELLNANLATRLTESITSGDNDNDTDTNTNELSIANAADCYSKVEAIMPSVNACLTNDCTKCHDKAFNLTKTKMGDELTNYAETAKKKECVTAVKLAAEPNNELLPSYLHDKHDNNAKSNRFNSSVEVEERTSNANHDRHYRSLQIVEYEDDDDDDDDDARDVDNDYDKYVFGGLVDTV